MDKLKVLIVEDDVRLHEIYKKGLPEYFFERRFSENGQSALPIYEEWRPDIVIIDIMLPVMSGYALLEKIRVDMGDPETTVIMATSVIAKDGVMKCIKLGIQGYIVKPIDHKEISKRVLECYREKEPDKADRYLDRLKKEVRFAP